MKKNSDHSPVDSSTSSGDTDDTPFRSGGILVIPSQEASISEDDYQEMVNKRRAEREEKIRSKGLDLNGLSTRFSDVTVQEYPITLGDNPGGKTVGPPLTIDWEPMSCKTLELQAYEKERKKELRHKEQLIMNPKDRKALLRRCGCSQEDILQAKADVKLIRKLREESTAGSIFGRTNDTLSEFGETLSNSALNILSLGGKRREERKLLKRFQSSHKSEYIRTSPCA